MNRRGIMRFGTVALLVVLCAAQWSCDRPGSGSSAADKAGGPGHERGIGGTTAAAPAVAASDSRVALVIGNASYEHNPLRNPVNDATDMAAALRECGFDVIEERDADKRAMKEALATFATRIQRGGTALFYYAGHGIQINNRNYLVPLHANPTGPSTIEFECLDAGRVLGTLEDAGAYLNIIVLDACRNNPLARAWTRDTRKGLASMDGPSGSIMAFATAAGNVAEDGPDRNGLYTGSLLDHLRTPGLDVIEVFRRTAADVQRQSAKGQVPWMSLSFTGRFEFVPAQADTVEVARVPDAGPGAPSVSVPEEPASIPAPQRSSQTAADASAAKLAAVRAQQAAESAQGKELATDLMGAGETALKQAEAHDTLEAFDQAVAKYGEAKAAFAKAEGEAKRIASEIAVLDEAKSTMVTAKAEADRLNAAKWAKVRYDQAAKVETAATATTERSEAARLYGQAKERYALAAAEAKEANPGPQPGETRTFAGIEMVWIPPGTFMMGSRDSAAEVAGKCGGHNAEAEWFEREHPQHQVTLTKGFWLGKHEVTQAQWQAVMGSNPSNFKGDNRLPVESVSWDDCQEFIAELNGRGEGQFRLPTEAEWEYACRAGTTTPFYSGETISTDQANYDGDYTYGNGKKGEDRGETTPVGSFPANAWGLHDMHGNVYEWCQDWYGEYPSGAVTDPTGPNSGSSRVLRGGSWRDHPVPCRSADRGHHYPPAYRNVLIGFRLLRTP